VFEPTHGSAPKYAGQYKVNPIAMLLTTKLMLDWLTETEMATRLETAIARVIKEGKVRTYKKHVRSPRRHGLAVARAAKIPRSRSPKPSPITPVRNTLWQIRARGD